MDTPHALAAAVAARPIVHPTIEPARRSFDHAGRRPLRVHGRPRHARIPPRGQAEVTPAPATPRWMLQALKAGILVAAGLALFVIGAAAARRATQAPATSPPPSPRPPPPRCLAPPHRCLAPPQPHRCLAPPQPPPHRCLAPPQPHRCLAPPHRCLAPPRPHRCLAPPQPPPYRCLAPPWGMRRRRRRGCRRRFICLGGGGGGMTTEEALRSVVVVPKGEPGPEVRSEEGEDVLAVVPFEGSAEGFNHYPLAQPRGVAVNLPNGRAALAMGRHTVQGDGFRWVWIRQHERGGIRIRFTLAYRTPEVLGVGNSRRRGRGPRPAGPAGALTAGPWAACRHATSGVGGRCLCARAFSLGCVAAM